MGSKQSTSNRLPKLGLAGDDGARLVTLTAGVTLYTDRVLSEVPGAVLRVYQRYLDECSADVLKFYATENMRRHKPVDRKVLAMLPTWLKPDAGPREYVHIELKDGPQHQDAPTYKLDVYGIEQKSSLFGRGRANYVSMAMPAAYARENSERFLGFVLDCAREFPFVSGHAGFTFEVSRYESEESQTYAWARSMRHVGIDIARPWLDAIAVGHDAVKTVSWLTLLSEKLASEVGLQSHRKRLEARGVELIEAGGGLILKAGDAPALGDVNRNERLPEYQEVYAVLEPLITRAAERSPSFDIEEDYVEKTRQWFRRLSRG
jgi:hypothetical protein